MARYIVLDCNSLCYRNHYAMKELISAGDQIGVIYGLLRDIQHYQDRFMAEHVVFTWDVGDPLRRTIKPDYKTDRDDDLTDEQIEVKQELHRQMRLLRKEYLGELGYRNNFWQKGYEADDIIASLCHHTFQASDHVVIISGDRDLYQLISGNVSVYHPTQRKHVTRRDFIEQYGIEPRKWAMVKALAGKKGEVDGIDGIGEILAIKSLTNQLKPTVKAYAKVLAGKERALANLNLTVLPFDGTPVFELVADNITKAGWKEVSKKLGVSLGAF